MAHLCKPAGAGSTIRRFPRFSAAPILYGTSPEDRVSDSNPYEFTGQELAAFGKTIVAEREALLQAAHTTLSELCGTRFGTRPAPPVAAQARFDGKAAYLLIGCPMNGQTVILEMVIERAEGDPPATLPAVLRTPQHGEVGMRIVELAVTPQLWNAAQVLMHRAALQEEVAKALDEKVKALWSELDSAARAAWARAHTDGLSLQFVGVERSPDELTYQLRFSTQSEESADGGGAITCGLGPADHIEVALELVADTGLEVMSETWNQRLDGRIGQLFRDAKILERRLEAIRLGADPAEAARTVHQPAWQTDQG